MAFIALVPVLIVDLRAHGRRRSGDRPRARVRLGRTQRSWRLISGRFWPTFGRMLLLVLITSIISAVVSPIFQVPGTCILPTTHSSSSRWRVRSRPCSSGPITYIGVTLLYYDIRIRKEGFDIEMLARSL